LPSIDVHQHLWPGNFIAALSGRSRPPLLRGSTLELGEGSFELDLAANELGARIAALDQAEIDLAVVSLQPTSGVGELPPSERDELIAVWEEGVRTLSTESGGRILPLAAGRDPTGFAGACVGAPALADLDGLAPLLGELERRGLFLFVHPGAASPPTGAPAWWSGIVNYAEQMQAGFYWWLEHGRKRWPALRVVFAILAGGAPFQLERLGQRGTDVRSTLDPNSFFDVATYGRRAIELCIETFGVHQLVYGSDVPVVDPAPTLRALRGFGHSVVQIVTTDNPTRLLT